MNILDIIRDEHMDDLEKQTLIFSMVAPDGNPRTTEKMLKELASAGIPRKGTLPGFIKQGVQPKPRAIKTESLPTPSPKVKDDIATYMSQRFGRKQPVKTFDEIGGKRTPMTDIDAPFTTTE